MRPEPDGDDQRWCHDLAVSAGQRLRDPDLPGWILRAIHGRLGCQSSCLQDEAPGGRVVTVGDHDHEYPHTLVMVVTPGHGSDPTRYAFHRDRDFSEHEAAVLTWLRPMVTMVHSARRLRRATPVQDGRPTSPLTPRERDVVDLLAHGLTTSSIARRLGIAKRTVDKHLEHVHAKLGTSGPVATVAEARRHQLLLLDGSA